MANRKKLTEAETVAILAALRRGEKVVAVARTFGLDRGTVRRLRDRPAVAPKQKLEDTLVIATRLSSMEARAFDAVAGRFGYRSRSDALRALARSASAMLEFSSDENARLDELSRQLNKIGVNVNQLARLANSGRLPVGGRQLDVLGDLRRDLAQLRAFMLDLTAERRRRGKKLFEQYARAERANG